MNTQVWRRVSSQTFAPCPLLWPSLPWDGIGAMHRRRSSTLAVYHQHNLSGDAKQKPYTKYYSFHEWSDTFPSSTRFIIVYKYECLDLSTTYYLIDNARSMRGELETFRFFDHNNRSIYGKVSPWARSMIYLPVFLRKASRIFSTRYWPGFLDLNTKIQAEPSSAFNLHWPETSLS